MPFCAKCGSEIAEGAQFCPSCGASVKIDPAPPTPAYTQPKTGSSNLFDRMIRAARLDVSLYEEVEADDTATTQAFIVVILASICSGIGTAIGTALTGQGVLDIGLDLFGGLFFALILWVVWSGITYFVGTRVFGGTASSGELLRTLGFSNSPGVLLILSFIPIVGGFISFAVGIWELVAMVVAVRQALDFTTGKAILSCIVGLIVALVILVIIGLFVALPFIFLGL